MFGRGRERERERASERVRGVWCGVLDLAGGTSVLKLLRVTALSLDEGLCSQSCAVPLPTFIETSLTLGAWGLVALVAPNC